MCLWIGGFTGLGHSSVNLRDESVYVSLTGPALSWALYPWELREWLQPSPWSTPRHQSPLQPQLSVTGCGCLPSVLRVENRHQKTCCLVGGLVRANSVMSGSLEQHLAQETLLKCGVRITNGERLLYWPMILSVLGVNFSEWLALRMDSHGDGGRPAEELWADSPFILHVLSSPSVLVSWLPTCYYGLAEECRKSQKEFWKY